MLIQMLLDTLRIKRLWLYLWALLGAFIHGCDFLAHFKLASVRYVFHELLSGSFILSEIELITSGSFVKLSQHIFILFIVIKLMLILSITQVVFIWRCSPSSRRSSNISHVKHRSGSWDFNILFKHGVQIFNLLQCKSYRLGLLCLWLVALSLCFSIGVDVIIIYVLVLELEILLFALFALILIDVITVCIMVYIFLRLHVLIYLHLLLHLLLLLLLLLLFLLVALGLLFSALRVTFLVAASPHWLGVY